MRQQVLITQTQKAPESILRGFFDKRKAFMSIDIKCEGCGGGLKYNPDKQGLHFANCGCV